jgi:serine/threonine protein kinase
MIIAQGHYGIVYLVTDGNTKFAIKRVLEEKRNKSREQDILKIVKHPHIIQHIHTFFSPSANVNSTLILSKKKMENYVNLVTDYLPETLGKVIKNYKKN